MHCVHRDVLQKPRPAPIRHPSRGNKKVSSRRSAPTITTYTSSRGKNARCGTKSDSSATYECGAQEGQEEHDRPIRPQATEAYGTGFPLSNHHCRTTIETTNASRSWPSSHREAYRRADSLFRLGQSRAGTDAGMAPNRISPTAAVGKSLESWAVWGTGSPMCTTRRRAAEVAR